MSYEPWFIWHKLLVITNHSENQHRIIVHWMYLSVEFVGPYVAFDEVIQRPPEWVQGVCILPGGFVSTFELQNAPEKYCGWTGHWEPKLDIISSWTSKGVSYSDSLAIEGCGIGIEYWNNWTCRLELRCDKVIKLWVMSLAHVWFLREVKQSQARLVRGWVSVTDRWLSRMHGFSAKIGGVVLGKTFNSPTRFCHQTPKSIEEIILWILLQFARLHSWFTFLVILDLLCS